MFRRLTDHLVDVAITGRVPDGARSSGEPFAENEIVLITAPDDPLARRRWVAIGELSSRPWLVREPGSGTRAMSEEFLSGHGVAPEIVTLGSSARSAPRRAPVSAWR